MCSFIEPVEVTGKQSGCVPSTALSVLGSSVTVFR